MCLLRAPFFCVMSEWINIESETTLYKLGMVMITHDNNLFKKFKTDSNLSFSMSLKWLWGTKFPYHLNTFTLSLYGLDLTRVPNTLTHGDRCDHSASLILRNQLKTSKMVKFSEESLKGFKLSPVFPAHNEIGQCMSLKIQVTSHLLRHSEV